MQNVQHRTCNACGNERKQRNLVYDPDTLKGYCKNPYICNSQHPNDPKNIVARGSEMVLVSHEEAFEAYNAKIQEQFGDDEMTAAIRRIVSSPITIRIANADMAKYVAVIALETKNTSEAVRYCIEKMMELFPHGLPEAPEPKPAPEPTPEPEPIPEPPKPVVEEEEEESNDWQF